MKLPVIRSLTEFIETYDQDYLVETLEVLEHLSGAPGLSDEELNVIGELISNLCGALDVSKEVRAGKPKKEALNDFMKKVLSSIDNPKNKGVSHD